jgi:hypothetical protein
VVTFCPLCGETRNDVRTTQLIGYEEVPMCRKCFNERRK